MIAVSKVLAKIDHLKLLMLNILLGIIRPLPLM